MTPLGFGIWDGDNHYYEPKDAFTRYIEPRHRTRAVRGTADNPMSQAEVEAKAFDLIGSVLGARRAKAILSAIGSLETVSDIAALRRLWQPSGKSGMTR